MLTNKYEEDGTAYIKIVEMSAVHMLIKKLFSTETFLTVSAAPFINIYVNLMLLLISEHVTGRMKSAIGWNLILFSFYEWHQILHMMHGTNIVSIFNPNLQKLNLKNRVVLYLFDDFPCCSTSFSGAMHLVFMLIFLFKSSRHQIVIYKWTREDFLTYL